MTTKNPLQDYLDKLRIKVKISAGSKNTTPYISNEIDSWRCKIKRYIGKRRVYMTVIIPLETFTGYDPTPCDIITYIMGRIAVLDEIGITISAWARRYDPDGKMMPHELKVAHEADINLAKNMARILDYQEVEFQKLLMLGAAHVMNKVDAKCRSKSH